mmetsp:Transcript_111029/g.313108  ORF Transcript_111029/g.313108 Transcript_111029/m.313108 type:complete len:113 (-) Transcript_111029:1045-1383(-)
MTDLYGPPRRQKRYASAGATAPQLMHSPACTQVATVCAASFSSACMRGDGRGGLAKTCPSGNVDLALRHELHELARVTQNSRQILSDPAENCLPKDLHWFRSLPTSHHSRCP